MSTLGKTYQQRTTHLLNRGGTGQNANNLLAHKIQPFERIISTGEATNEEFAEFIWQCLPRLYTDNTRMMNAFEAHFDRDWSNKVDRAGALVDLVAINRSRDKGKRIRLFVEE